MDTNTSQDQQSKDAGLALVLILLIIYYFAKIDTLILPALVVLVLVMAIPKVFRPFAIIWFGFSHHLGNFVSKIILTLLFYIILVPISLIRRMLKADPLQLEIWQSSNNSAFKTYNHQYEKSDLKNPY